MIKYLNIYLFLVVLIICIIKIFDVDDKIFDRVYLTSGNYNIVEVLLTL